AGPEPVTRAAAAVVRVAVVVENAGRAVHDDGTDRGGAHGAVRVVVGGAGAATGASAYVRPAPASRAVREPRSPFRMVVPLREYIQAVVLCLFGESVGLRLAGYAPASHGGGAGPPGAVMTHSTPAVPSPAKEAPAPNPSAAHSAKIVVNHPAGGNAADGAVAPALQAIEPLP